MGQFRSRARLWECYQSSIERLERRALLSQYATSIAPLPVEFPGGAFPESGLVADANGDFFGTTSSGGAENKGTVYEIPHGTGSVTTLASFGGPNGASPYAGLTLDSAGDLLGTTYSGGASNDGTVFEISSGSSTINVLVSFNGSNGANPYGGVTIDSHGNLFGTTYAGGLNGDGTVFEISNGSTGLTTVTAFNGTNGANPRGTVILDSSGDLFGTTSSAGSNSDGTVFEVQAGASSPSTLATFNGSNGAQPYAGLTMDSAGDMLGTTYSGGANSDGTIFEISSISHQFTSLASFNGSNGANPECSLAVDPTGDALGTAYMGGKNKVGCVFELASGGKSIADIADFNGPNGANPLSSLVLDSIGDVFGTTYHYGATRSINHIMSITNPEGGTVFEVVHGSDAVTTLAAFTATNGFNPGSFAVDAAGDLFGATGNGGAYGWGTIFEISHGTESAETIASIAANSSAGCLVLDSHGDLFGVLSSTISTGGTVFEIQAGQSNLTTIATLGDVPTSIIPDANGNLFGTTAGGSLFEIPSDSQAATTLFTLNSGAGQYNLEPGIWVDPSGNIYGEYVQNGMYSDNLQVFELPNGSQDPTNLAELAGVNDVAEPTTLVVDAEGDVFGNVFQTGAVFEIQHGSNVATVVGSVINPEGIVLDSEGNLFGFSVNDQQAFEIPNGSQTLTVIGTPVGNLGDGTGVAIDSVGNLYGVARSGTNGTGSVFEISPTDVKQSLNVLGSYALPAGVGPGISVVGYNSVTLAPGASFTASVSVPSSNRCLIQTGTLALPTSNGSWAGSLDLGNNDLDVAQGNVAQLTSEVAQGFATGANGIYSSAAAADSTHLTTLGVIQNSVDGTTTGAALYGDGSPLGTFDGTNPANTDVLVKYTYFGDANLDGKVDGSDYTRIDAGFLSRGASHPLTGWFIGDFNYDGVINGSDYTLIDNAFNRQGAQISALLEEPTAAVAVAQTSQVTPSSVEFSGSESIVFTAPPGSDDPVETLRKRKRPVDVIEGPRGPSD
jgi:uncharacterized repeat protein (TIGR03803 family)